MREAPGQPALSRRQRLAALWTGLDADLRVFLLGYAVLLPLYLLPLLVTRYLPGLDLPFHLSLVDMLQKDGRADSPYRQIYAGSLRPSPYMAHYLALYGLGKLLPLTVVHKLIMGLYAALLPLSLAALLHACGRSRLPALAAFVLVYNMTVHYGFISFALSIPVLLLLLHRCTRLLTAEPAPRRLARESAVLAVLAALLFLCHLQNYLFGLLCALTLLVLAGRGVSWRPRLSVLLSVVPSLLLLLLWQRTTSYAQDPARHKTSLTYALRLVFDVRRFELHHGLARDFVDRAVALPEHLLRGFADRVDRVAATGFFALLAGYAVLGLVLGGRPGPPARLRLGTALCLIGGLLAYFVLPHHLRELELMTLYPRFAVLAAALLALCVPAGLLRVGPRLRLLCAAPALLLSSWYGVELVRHYARYGAETADFAAVLDRTPPGGKLVGLVYNRYSKVMDIGSALVALPAYYPVERRAPGSLVQVLYCGMRHMPCRILDPSRVPPAGDLWEPQRSDLAKAVGYFDYFLARSGPRREVLFGALRDQIETIHCKGTWCVYGKIHRAAPPGGGEVGKSRKEEARR